MITKEELVAMNGDGLLQSMYPNPKTQKPYFVRLVGKLRTWKTRPDEFSQTVKYGLNRYCKITADNAHGWKKVT